MGYPPKLLTPGEEIVLDLRQHVIALRLAILWTLLIIGVVVFAGWWFLGKDWNWAFWALLVAGIVAFAVLAGWRFATWATTYFVLTTERVVSRSGVIAKKSIDIPLDSINDIHFNQTIFERMFGSGNLVISSASTFGNNTFRFIRDPERVQNLIYHQREEAERHERREQAAMQAEAMMRYQTDQHAQQTPGQPATGWSGAQAPPAHSAQSAAAQDIPAQIARLAELRDQGTLTETEFQAKKAELLGRM